MHPSTRAIRPLREEMGLTQAVLAGRAGISQGYLSQLETWDHAASIESLSQIARGLGVPFCGLLARLDYDCGCGHDWGELSRHPVMRLFGQLSSEDSVLIVELMRRLTCGQPQAGAD